MKKDKIISILEDWNYWSKPLKETFSRETYEKEVFHKSTTNEILFLKWVRRSGKSTILLNDLINVFISGIPKEQILFVNLEEDTVKYTISKLRKIMKLIF
jgi:predicted AAA+ superfamily ATPase